MRFYKPVRTPEDLAAVASNAVESWEIDFKQQGTSDWWEIAKDIAAFANSLGGVLLYGVTDKGHFIGLTERDAASIKRDTEHVVRDKCSPCPLFTIEPIEYLGKHYVAVNVEPTPEQLVGAMFYSVNEHTGKKETSQAWRFYVREGTNNIPVSPERLPMYMNVKARRIAIQVSNIPSAAIVRLLYWYPNSKFSEPNRQQLKAVAVDMAKNVFAGSFQDDFGTYTLRVPLDDVRSVWEDEGGEWNVLTKGFINENCYRPSKNTAD